MQITGLSLSKSHAILLSFFECLTGLVFLGFFHASSVVIPVQLTQLTVSHHQGYKTELPFPFSSGTKEGASPFRRLRQVVQVWVVPLQILVCLSRSGAAIRNQTHILSDALQLLQGMGATNRSALFTAPPALCNVYKLF